MSGAAQPKKPRRQSLEPGMTIAERYVVQSVLGQGGMGQVLEVEHVSLGRRFALKVLRLERWNDELVRRFNREARALAKLTTPRVAQVTDFGVDGDSGPFYVMELLEGETLEDRLERHSRLSPREALTIGASLCDALTDCHAAGIVHRDLKPSNVGLPNTGPVLVKLLDFGLAASMDDAFLSKITQSQQILGSLPYMAPEQFNGAPAAPSMDVYATGICLYESLSGRLPFMAPSTAALIHQILSTPMPALPPELTGLGPLSDLLERMLAKEPERRFASTKAAGQAMREALKAMGGPAPELSSHPRTRSLDGPEPMPRTAEAQAVAPDPFESDRVGMMPTLMAESGTRLSGSAIGHANTIESGPMGGTPTVEEPSQPGFVPEQLARAHTSPPQPQAWHSEVVPPTPPAGTRPFGSSVDHASQVPVVAPPIHPPTAGAQYAPHAPGQPIVGAGPTPGPSPWGFRIAVAALLGLIVAGLMTIGLIVAINVLGSDGESDTPPPLPPEPAVAVEPTAPEGPAEGPGPTDDGRATSDGETDDSETDDDGEEASAGEVEPPEPVTNPEPRSGRRSGRSGRSEPTEDTHLEPQIRPLGPASSGESGRRGSGQWNGNAPIDTF